MMGVVYRILMSLRATFTNDRRSRVASLVQDAVISNSDIMQMTQLYVRNSNEETERLRGANWVWNCKILLQF